MIFNPETEARHITLWIREWFRQFGRNKIAVVGISGGKDSTIAAAFCAQALGPNRVLGVIMPNGNQPDLDDAKRVIEILGIQGMIANIGGITASIEQAVIDAEPIHNNLFRPEITSDVHINVPPRVRMTLLRAFAQSRLDGGGIYINTCNLSEDYIGYSTKDGDGTGDIAPLQGYTVTELLQIGQTKFINLPKDLVLKIPSDGLCGKSDEENIGFTYAVLDRYIRTGKCEDASVRAAIIQRHNANLHKLMPMPSCKPIFLE